MKKTLHTVSVAALAAAFSTAAFAQEIPLNIFVTGSTGGELTQGQTSGSLSATTSTTASMASAATKMVVSTASSTSTN
ncbi:hypothetical protein [uncultured Tateyamaria sp.]|uniref:hypothetical protein n=1 Tax=uncultured Tateyamaria sp. TaxID=455651 RepID=UPI002625017A|nr:hypothetical protein [uncultured Tateyamaria sp.]